MFDGTISHIRAKNLRCKLSNVKVEDLAPNSSSILTLGDRNSRHIVIPEGNLTCSKMEGSFSGFFMLL
jgi:hypothetical protein